MPIVIVEKIAAGVQMTKEQLESALTDLQKVVVKNDAGRPCHLEGGEAVIWRAGRDGEYAIKAFKEITRGRAEPEFEKLQVLQPSGYTPRVYGFGTLVEDDGVEYPAIIEEYVRGTSLADLVSRGRLTGNARDGRLDALDTARIALELTRGIRELHGAGLAHRDISPNNVLLDDSCVEDRLEKGVVLRLVDFGTSTNVSRTDATALVAGPRLAAIPYGAPEVFGGDYYHSRPLADGLAVPGRDSSYTDVWSIGAIIVFLMWGEYWPKDIEDIYLRQRVGQFRAAPSDLERIAEAKRTPIDLIDLVQQQYGQVTQKDKDLAGTVRRCTEYDPTLRFSVDQLKTNLLAMLTRWEEKDAETHASRFTPVFDSSRVRDAKGDSANGVSGKTQDLESLGTKKRDTSNRSMTTKGKERDDTGSDDFESQGSTRQNDKGFVHTNEGEVYNTLHKDSRGKRRSRSVPLVAIAVALVAAVSFAIAVFVSLSTQNRQKVESTTSETVEEGYVYDLPNKGELSDVDGAEPSDISGESQPDDTVLNVSVQSGINDYSWDELKTLANAIAKAESDDEGLAIAKAYNLEDEDGKLQGETKGLTLGDGTKTSVRILGFRHDVMADGSTAGVSFEFANVPMTHIMNAKPSNKGGWKASSMRAWLNDDFLTTLPSDLRNLIVPVGKMANNVGRVKREGNTSVVTSTTDKLWLLSSTEVYGTLSEQTTNVPWSATTYDAEGTQYQLYADQRVSTTNYGYCKKDGTSSWWWLRSPRANFSDGFRLVLSDGGWLGNDANSDGGVSPGFCF